MPAKIVYGLYAVSYMVGITGLAGVIYAYLSRGKGPVLDSHLTFLIRTFWLSLLLAIIAFVTVVFVVGFVLFLLLVVWGVTRIISGFALAYEGKPITGTKHFGIWAY